MDTNSLKAWLGDALDQLDDDQLALLQRESDRLDRIYSDPDEVPLWDAAMSATVQYVLGETTVEEVGKALGKARWEVALAMAAAKQVAVVATQRHDVSERAAAFRAAIDKKTLIAYRAL